MSEDDKDTPFCAICQSYHSVRSLCLTEVLSVKEYHDLIARIKDELDLDIDTGDIMISPEQYRIQGS